jgi:hypothetical protein
LDTSLEETAICSGGARAFAGRGRSRRFLEKPDQELSVVSGQQCMIVGRRIEPKRPYV